MSNKLSLIVNFLGVDRLSGSLRNITQLGRQGSRSLGDLRGEGRRLESQLREVRRQMAGASGNVSALVDQERDLEAAIDRTNRELAERKRLTSIEAGRRAMVDRGAGLMDKGRDNMVQGAALAAPLILAVKAAGEFSSGMVDIQQKMNLTDTATAGLASRIIGMAKDAKRMPEDMRAGLDMLGGLGGLSLQQIEAAMVPAGRLATAFKVEMPDAAATAHAAITNLKVPAAQTAAVFDAMAAAGKEGGFEIKDMARHFPALTAQMQALGDTGVPAVADLSAALQVVRKVSGNADEAGNNVKNLLAKINAPGTINAFKKNFGVDLPKAMAKLTAEGYSSLEAIAMVTQQATGGDLKKLGFAFEDMQAQSALRGLILGIDEYRAVREKAMKSGGTVDKAFAQRAANDAMVNWEAFKGSVSSLAITLGKTLLPAATEAMNMIIGLGNSITAWAQANPQAAATLTKMVAGLAVFKVGLGAAQFAIGGFMKPLASVNGLVLRFAGSWGNAFAMMRVAAMFLARGLMQAGLMMLANPVILAITVLVLAIGGAAYLIYTHWDKIKAAFAQGVAFLTGLGARMASIGRMIISGLVAGLRAAGGAVWQTLKNIVFGGIQGVKNLLGIKSPSRVFMAIGQHTGEGMAIGIDRQRGRVMGATGGLAKGAAAAGALALSSPAMAGQGAGGGAGGQGAAPVTINIYQQPSEDMTDLARRVADELRRAQAGASRRAYGDSN